MRLLKRWELDSLARIRAGIGVECDSLGCKGDHSSPPMDTESGLLDLVQKSLFLK